MDITEVEAAIERSLARESTLKQLESGRREQLAKSFAASRLTPEMRQIYSHAFCRDTTPLPSIIEVYFVTDHDPQSVIFDPASGEFGVAWGPLKDGGAYFLDCLTGGSVLLAQLLCE